MNWFAAYDEGLAPLLGSTGAVALLTGAESSGLLMALREPATVPELAARTSTPETVVLAVCRALVSFEILVPEGDTYRLTEPWLVLTADDAFSPLSMQLAQADVQFRMLRAALAGDTYWTASPEDRLVLARAISPDPFSDSLVAGFAESLSQDADYAVLADGGIQLELGCGVAGRILTTLRALPRMRAIGIEIAPDLAEIARDRAEQLGVADRFEVVVGDAAEFDRVACADAAFWSQFFFPRETRSGALAALHRALRPGGILIATLFGDEEAEAADPTSTDARETAVSRVALATWGIPLLTQSEVTEEIRAAGFTDVELVRRGSLPRIRAVRP